MLKNTKHGWSNRNTIACGLHTTPNTEMMYHAIAHIWKIKPGCDYLTLTQLKPDKETRLEAGGT